MHYFVIGDWIFSCLQSSHIKIDESFPKIYYMLLFQTQSSVTKNFWSPSNNQVFSDGNWNHFRVAIRKVTETLFRLLAITIFCRWQLNLWSPTSAIFCHLQLEFWLPWIVVHRVQQELFKKYYKPPFQIELLVTKIFLITIQQSSFLGWRPKTIFSCHT